MAYKDLTVLVVDDFSTMRRIVRNVLRELDFKNILEADDGTTAVEVLGNPESGPYRFGLEHAEDDRPGTTETRKGQ